MDPLLGQTLLKRYRIEAFIGRGGMADVYKAFDLQRNAYVAIKLLREDLAQDLVFRRKFRREAAVLQALNHPNIVRFYSFEEEGLLAFLVLEFIAGQPLRALIASKEGKPFSPEEALAYLEPVCRALHYGHSQGVYHCDVKPGNILVEEHTGRVVVSDFGIAKLAESATVTTSTPGTPAYMSPEQCRGKGVDQRTDVYSLGVTVYEMLTGGERPFVGETVPGEGSTAEKIRWEQINEQPPSARAHNAELPLEAEEVILKALAKEPDDRYESVFGLLEAYQEATDQIAAIPHVEEASRTPPPAVAPPETVTRTGSTPERAPPYPLVQRSRPGTIPGWLLPTAGCGGAIVVLITILSLVTSVGGWLTAPPLTSGTLASPTPRGVLATVSASKSVAAGDALFAEGRYDEAVAQYRMALRLDARDAEVYARLGQAYLQQENCDSAIPEFQQALALDPTLEAAQAGLLECGGDLPPEISFSAYSRSDLRFSLLYPSAWFVREEEVQSIFAAEEEYIELLTGDVFFISSLALAPDEEAMDSMGALIKARQLIDLPMGSQLGGVELASFGEWEWATVQGQISGLEPPPTIYVAATVKDSNWYGIWAIAPADTWEQTSWPVFRAMADSVQLE